MNRSCCGIRGVRLLRVGDVEVGLTGVDAAMKLLYVEGWSPDDEDLGRTFVQQLRDAGNYIPANQESLYFPVLVELFRNFYEDNATNRALAGSGRRS